MTAPQYVDLTITEGDVIRFAMLMTHYRSPLDMEPNGKMEQRRAQARKALRRFAMACEPNMDGPPLEVIETLSNDLNTPGVIAILHRYRAEKRGRSLFAALRFLGFFGSTCLPDEIKTLPKDHIWQAQLMGPDVQMDTPQ